MPALPFSSPDGIQHPASSVPGSHDWLIIAGVMAAVFVLALIIDSIVVRKAPRFRKDVILAMWFVSMVVFVALFMRLSGS